MTNDVRTNRVKHIRDTLECGMQRAVEIERGRLILKKIDAARWRGANRNLCDAMREMALDQYRIRDFDMRKLDE